MLTLTSDAGSVLHNGLEARDGGGRSVHAHLTRHPVAAFDANSGHVVPGTVSTAVLACTEKQRRAYTVETLRSNCS